jgi:uncharacterized protein
MVRFNRRARLDTSQFRSRPGGGRGGGGRGIAVGGGGLGLLVLVVALLTGVDPSALLGPAGDSGAPSQRDPAFEQCRTGADAGQRQECRFVAFENSIQDYWAQAFDEAGSRYTPATFTSFTGGVRTGCGAASSSVGPFYCPADQGVYMDLGFFEELRTRFGAQGGDFTEAYVVAHEFGHHVQNLTGANERVRTREGPDSDAVRLELQADCYAGVWAAHATTTPAEGGEPLITEISQADIAEAVDAAQVIGDDYIQERFNGNVTPETWTHGSSEQRVRWFQRGLDTGSPGDCDTFSARSL